MLNYLWSCAAKLFYFFYGLPSSIRPSREGVCSTCGDVTDDLHFWYGLAFVADFCKKCCPGREGEFCDHNCAAGATSESTTDEAADS